MRLLGLEVPPVTHLFEWKDMGAGFNKTALVMALATAMVFLIFGLGSRRRALVPAGLQNAAEAGIEMVEKNVVEEVMGHDGAPWAPYLTALFFFIFFCNIWSIIPFIQFPATSRIALTGLLAILTWILMIFMGVKKQGLRYFKDIIWPPGVPNAMRWLVGAIELVSKILVRPFSLAVRLFANLVAGHVLLTVAGVMCAALWRKQWIAVFLPGPLLLGIFMTAFEVLVAVLQAYIFTILTAVYLQESIHPEH